MLSENAKTEIRALQARYPVPRSALGPALYVAQREIGWLPSDVMAEVGALFGLDEAEVGEFASFYHMYWIHGAPGEYKIEVCDNVPCMLRGSSKLTTMLEERLGVPFGQSTPDGKVTLGHVECLGACATAPMFMCTEQRDAEDPLLRGAGHAREARRGAGADRLGPGVRHDRALANGPVPPRRPPRHEFPARAGG